MINDVHTTNGKTIPEVLSEFKNEFSTFVATRLQMLQEEMKQKATTWKAAIPMIVVGALFLLTAWFAVTGAIVVAIAVAMPNNPWAYVISFGCVFVLYGILGGMLAIMGKNALTREGVKPEKTMRVLQQDKVWLQSEATRLQA